MDKVSETVKLDLREPGMTPRRLRYTFEAGEETEDLTGVPFAQTLAELQTGRLRLRHWRMLLYAGLRAGGTKREGETLTADLVREKVKRYCESGGYMQDITNCMVRALNAAAFLRTKEADEAAKAAEEKAAELGRPTDGETSSPTVSPSLGGTADSPSTPSGE